MFTGKQGYISAREFALYEKYYHFPFHALVEFKAMIETLSGVKEILFHLPLPIFNVGLLRQRFVLSLPVSDRIRGDDFFACRYCGKKSLFTLKDCTCLKEVDELNNYSSINERYQYEEKKKVIKDELLHKIDSGETDLGIYEAKIVLADPEIDDNQGWNLAEMEETEELSIGDYISVMWRKVDEWLQSGKIPPLTRVGDQLILIDPEMKFYGIIAELEQAVGFKIPREHQPFKVDSPVKFVTCERCGTVVRKHHAVQLMSGTKACNRCASEDPEAAIEALLITADSAVVDGTDIIDPTHLEELTFFREGSPDNYSRHTESAIIILIESPGSARYFVLPFEPIPEESEEKISEEEAVNSEDDEEEEEIPEEIYVEGSEEIRRKVKGIWQHRHESYDYWHPMARVHKELRPIFTEN